MEKKTTKKQPEPAAAQKPGTEFKGTTDQEKKDGIKPETKKGDPQSVKDILKNKEAVLKAPAKKIELKQIDWFDDHFYKIRYENDQKVEVEVYIPSVTTKLGALSKPQLQRWYGDVGNREAFLRMTEASDRGSRIHWAWECFTSGGVVIYHPDKTPLFDNEELEELKKRYNQHYFILRNQDEMWNFMKLEAFHKAVKPTFSLSEQKVFNLDTMDAGTMDNLFGVKEGTYLINGSKPVKLETGLYLFDAKTGSYVGAEAKMQLSAYWACLVWMARNKFIELPEDMEIQGAIIGHTSAKTRSGIEGFSATVIPKDEIEDYYRRYRNIAAVWESEFSSMKPKIRQIPGYVAL